MSSLWSLAFLSFALLGANAQTSEFYSFDGVGFPTCYNVTTVHNATSVDDSEFPDCTPKKKKKGKKKGIVTETF